MKNLSEKNLILFLNLSHVYFRSDVDFFGALDHRFEIRDPSKPIFSGIEENMRNFCLI